METDQPLNRDAQAIGPPKPAKSRAIYFAISLLLIATTLYLCTRLGFALMFRGFQNYDDEGATLMVLDQMAHGHVLYDQIGCQYGPLGFFPKYALIRILSLSIDHDTGRSLTLLYWMLSCAALGAAARRLCGSVAWSCIAAIASCLVLSLIANEPGHSQDMCCLLISLAVLVATFFDAAKARRYVAILGALGGLLAMTKINLAVFYAAALGAALIFSLPAGRSRFRFTCLLAASLMVGPFLLVLHHFDKPWAVLFAAQISIALLACVVVAMKIPGEAQINIRTIALSAMCFVAAALLVVAVTMILGSSIGGMISGIITLALRVSESFYFTQGTHLTGAIASAIGLVFALLLRQTANFRRPLAVVRVLAGLVVLYLVRTSDRWDILNFAPAFSWILLLPTQGNQRTFARLFLAFLAIAEALWAYPVCGTQLAMAVFLLTLIGVVTLADGFRDLAVLFNRSMLQRTGGPIVCTVVLIFMSVVTSQANSQYESQTPLDLPGSHLIRLTPANAVGWRVLVDNLNENTDLFITMPCLNSFYFWTHLPPPSPTNLTQWMYLLNGQQQSDIIDAIKNHSRACLLYNPTLSKFWMQGRIPAGPLVDYLNQNFRPAFSIGDWIFEVKNDRKSAVEILPDGTHQLIELAPATRP